MKSVALWLLLQVKHLLKGRLAVRLPLRPVKPPVKVRFQEP